MNCGGRPEAVHERIYLQGDASKAFEVSIDQCALVEIAHIWTFF